MSAVNPASVVNPAGIMQVPPPSAIGPGAIIHSNSPNASLPVGPGFGNSSYRSNDQYGEFVYLFKRFDCSDIEVGRAPASNVQANPYDEGYYPFAQQLPAFNGPNQGQYGMQWGQAQPSSQDVYNRYNPYPLAPSGYPNATASGTPVNYNAYYPPAPFSTSPAPSGGPAMYPGAANTGYYPHPSGSTGGHGGQVPTSNAHNGNHPTNAGRSTPGSIHSNGYKSTTTHTTHTPYDASLVNALQNMSFNK